MKYPRDLTKPPMKVRFCQNKEEEWLQGGVVSRATKRSTGNWHFMKVKHQQEESAQWINLKGAK